MEAVERESGKGEDPFRVRREQRARQARVARQGELRPGLRPAEGPQRREGQEDVPQGAGVKGQDAHYSMTTPTFWALAMLTWAATCRAIWRKASAAVESGARAVTGLPASPPSRSATSSGTSPRKGTP